MMMHQLDPLQLSIQNKAQEAINVSVLSRVCSPLGGKFSTILVLLHHGPPVLQSQLESPANGNSAISSDTTETDHS